MAQAIIMPKAGMAMEEGTILKWLKAEGDQVEQGEPLLEILTDKVNMEVEAQATGTLLKILKPEGAVVPVIQTIGYIGKPGEILADAAVGESSSGKAPVASAPAEPSPAQSPSGTTQPGTAQVNLFGKIAATPAARRLASEREIDLNKVRPTGLMGEIKFRDVLNFKPVLASPLARKIAEVNGLDLASISGSGHDSKIMKQDVAMKLQEQAAPGASVATAATLASTASEPAVLVKPLKGIRKIIAERMLKSHLEIPPVTLNVKADVTELAKLREQINSAAAVKFTYNDFILKACAIALKAYPMINSSLAGNEIIQKEAINIGMAVALEDGLTVPVIKNTDRLSMSDLSATAKELSAKARSGSLSLDDLQGGTFTVSNLGAFDVISFNPIINQPESAILGVCAIEDVLKMIDGKIEVRKIMGLSLTFDHRIIDGALGAMFVKKIKTILENPLQILI